MSSQSSDTISGVSAETSPNVLAETLVRSAEQDLPSVEQLHPFFDDPHDDFTLDRLKWLIQLRWIAMVGLSFGVLLIVLGHYEGPNWPVLLGVVVLGGIYNAVLHVRHVRGVGATGRRAAQIQAMVDFGMLTVALWAGGGTDSPFMVYYAFHVVLAGTLAGVRAAVIAAGMSGVGASFLLLTKMFPVLRIGVWRPEPPWDLVANSIAFVTTLIGLAYLVTHAVRELRDRERALARAKDRVALEYQLLSHTLNSLEAGLEVVDHSGRVIWRNKRAARLAPPAQVGEIWHCPSGPRHCERDASGVCPVQRAMSQSHGGRCRFAADVRGQERVYEMLAFPLPARADGSRVMNLYVDRTEATLDERRLVLAERLVSLGRVAQGVAHELNTPLATIRTLATDMREALGDLRRSEDLERRELMLSDLDESAELVRDETERLGRITQALLAGGDLVRANIADAVPLSSVVQRARAIVTAGRREAVVLDIDRGVEDLTVWADPDRLMQVLVNLLQNASDAVREVGGQSVVVRATVNDGFVEIAVQDDGPGLAPEVLAHLFEPFTTTKPPGEGTGLGLYTSYMLVQGMGGELTLKNGPEGGVVATVRLPKGAATRPG